MLAPGFAPSDSASAIFSARTFAAVGFDQEVCVRRWSSLVLALTLPLTRACTCVLYVDTRDTPARTRRWRTLFTE
jgi:hypothetical protein